MLTWIIILGSVALVLLALFLLSKFSKKNKSDKSNPLKRYYPKKEKDSLHPEQKTLNNFPTTSLKESDF